MQSDRKGSNCVRSTRTKPLISVGCPLQSIGKIFWDCICVNTHLPRFDTLAYIVPHFNALTHMVVPVLLNFSHLFLDCLRKVLFMCCLIVLVLKALFKFFLIVELASLLWHSFTDEILALIKFLFISGLFIVFLAFIAVFNKVFLYRKNSILRQSVMQICQQCVLYTVFVFMSSDRLISCI